MPYGPIGSPKPVTAVVLGVPRSEYGETLATLRQRLVDMLGGRDDLDKIRLDGWINDAYTEVSTSFEFVETEAMLRIVVDPSQPFYTMPDNIDYIKHVSLALTASESSRQGKVLDNIDIDSYRELPESMAYTQGAKVNPVFYTHWNQWLIIYPTPYETSTITLDLVIVPQPLTKDTDSPILSRDWHRAILLKAKQLVLSDTNDPQGALLAENTYVKFVQSRGNRIALRKANRYASVSMPGRGYRNCENGFDLGWNSGNPFVDRGSDF